MIWFPMEEDVRTAELDEAEEEGTLLLIPTDEEAGTEEVTGEELGACVGRGEVVLGGFITVEDEPGMGIKPLL